MFKSFNDFLKESTQSDQATLSEAEVSQTLPILATIVNLFEEIRRQAQTSHWNIRGTDFLTLHKTFGEVYDLANESIDKVAERFLSLSVSTPNMIAVSSQFIPVATQDKAENISLMVNILNMDAVKEMLIGLDVVSENMLQEIIADFEKHRWFIDSSK